MTHTTRILFATTLGAALALTACADAPYAATNAQAREALDEGRFGDAQTHLTSLFTSGEADERTQRIKLDLMLQVGDGYAAMAAIDALPDTALNEAERRIAKAHAFLLQGNPGAAADLYEALEPADFSEQDFRMTLWILRELGEDEEFDAGLEAALQAYPDSADINAMAARALIDIGSAEEAAPFVERALASEPTHYQALLAAGEVAIAEENLDAALDAYRKAADAWPDFALPRANIAGLQLDRGEVEAAGKTLKAAIAAHPGEPFLQWQMARYALATDDLETARAAIETARRAFRGNDEFTLLSAQAEERFGNRTLALSEYQRYLKAVGEDAAVAAKIAALKAGA